MNYLSGAINFIAGSDADASAANVVPRLVERIASCALPQDRRAAIVELVAASATSPARQADVGERGVKVIYAVLEQDKEFDDTLRPLLELLVNICGVIEPASGADGQHTNGARSPLPELSEDDIKRITEESRAVASTNTDAFLGLPNAMSMLLELLDNTDVMIRCSTIEVLTAMSANSRQTVQAAILGAPQGVARLADLLDDGSSIVRTNATLLLSTVSQESPEICKIVAFSGVLETLFRAMDRSVSTTARANRDPSEGLNDPDALEAAIVVQDSLQLVSTLLSGSASTHSFVRDSGSIPRLAAILTSAAEASALSPSMYAADSMSSGPAAAVARQNFANVLLALDCVRHFVSIEGADKETNKAVCTASGLFRSIMQLCFGLPAGPHHADRTLVQVSAMETGSLILRGHEESRSVFVSPLSTLGGPSRSRSPQLVASDIMTSEQSYAVRAAAYRLLRDSLVVDPALDLPGSSVLNALVTGASEGETPVSATAGVAAALKSSIVGWPGDADGAGVYYACCVVGWIVSRLRGARERLLGAYVSASGDSLLKRSVRALGLAEREGGPVAVRIGLLRLLCTWLYQSPSAVSAFLSSAMHLPLLVELVTKTAPRSDLAAGHVQGLAALLLGICLESAEGEAGGTMTEGGFISGGAGASTVVPRATLVDLVRTRIGISAFTARLDDLRATPAYLAGSQDKTLPDSNPMTLARKERLSEHPPEQGHVGHELWYDSDFIAIIDDVYARVGGKVLDMVSEQPKGTGALNGAADSHKMSGQDTGVVATTGSEKTTLGATAGRGHPKSQPPLYDSSSKDEVLVSYKELIRSQDVSLSQARTEIEELQAALKETQVELDAKVRSETKGSSRAEKASLKSRNEELEEQVAALNSVLKQKDEEFAALSEAYATLEADQGAGADADGADVDGGSAAEIRRLREESASWRSQYYAECDKVARLEDKRGEDDLHRRSLETKVDALTREQDALRSGAAHDLGDAARWRASAEAAEGELAAIRSRLDELVEEKSGLSTRATDALRERDETLAQMATLNGALDDVKSDMSKLQSTRRREQQMAREALAQAEQAAQSQIQELQSALDEVRSTSRTSNQPENETDNTGAAEKERQDLSEKVSKYAEEITDLQNSVGEWKRRAEEAVHEASETKTEIARLSAAVRESQVTLAASRSSTQEASEALNASRRRVAELEERCSELDEMRSKLSDELEGLRDEVATRSEQSIRLSGKVYEAEEAKALAEKKVEELEERLTSMQQKSEGSGSQPQEAAAETTTSSGKPARSSEDEDYIAILSEEILQLKSRISEMQATIRSHEDKAELRDAITADRDRALAQIDELQSKLRDAEAELKQTTDMLESARQEALSHREAEDAKRRLSQQVGELQRALDEERAGREAELTHRAQGSADNSAGVSEELSALRVEVDEKNMRLKELESALDTLAGNVGGARALQDLEKRVSESDALLSVLSSEKNEKIARISALEDEIETLQGSLKTSEEKLATLGEQFQSAETERTEWQNAAKKWEEDHGKASESLSEMGTKIKSLEEALHSEGERVQDLERRVADGSANEIRLQAELESAQADLDAKTRAVGKLEDAMSTQSAEKHEMQQDAENLQARISDLEKVALDREREAEQSKGALAALEASTSDATSAKEQIGRLETELKSRIGEVSELRMSLLSTSGDIEIARRERDIAVKELAGLREAAAVADNEIGELKKALADAARSFKESAKELAEREELMVDLSRDKTELTSELANSRTRVESLKAEIEDTAVQHVSETDRLRLEIETYKLTVEKLEATLKRAEQTSSVSTDSRGPVKESMQSTDEEWEGLDAIEGLVRGIESKFTALEKKHASMRAELSAAGSGVGGVDDTFSTVHSLAKPNSPSSDATAIALRTEVASLRSKLAATNETHSASIAGKDATIARSSQALSEALLDVASKAQIIQSLTQELGSREEALSELETQKKSLSLELDEALKACAAFKSSKADAEVEKENLRGKCDAMERDCETARKALREAENQLKLRSESMAALEVELCTTNAANTVEQTAMNGRMKELESEVDSGIEKLETSERRLRDATISLRALKSKHETEVASLAASLENATSSLRAKESEISALLATHEDKISGLSGELESARARADDTAELLKAAQERCEQTENELRRSHTELTDAGKSITELRSELEVLGSKNEKTEADKNSLTSQVQELECEISDKNRILAEREADLKRGQEEATKLASDLDLRTKELESTSAEGARLRVEVDRLRNARGRLEEDIDGLSSKLDAAEAARDAAEKDNTDLRQWVADLEKQGSALQEVLEKFEEVEQSLDEAVSAHTAAVESNAALSAELDSVKEKLELETSRAKALVAERDGAVHGQGLARRQVEDLESRLQEIRSVHLTKLSSTEDAIRSNTRRCAELESELASAERRLAETATLSDKVFALETELTRARSEASVLHTRIESAKKDAIEAQQEVTRLEKELEIAKSTAGGAAYAELEAEHNELLVCLADLELECSVLKDAAATGTPSRTTESVSVR